MILGKVNEVIRKVKIESLEKDDIKENVCHSIESKNAELRAGRSWCSVMSQNMKLKAVGFEIDFVCFLTLR